MRYDDLYLWFLADPAVPRYVGQLRLVEAGKGVSLQYGADWLAGGFPLSEDLVLTDIEQLPRCARRPRLSRSRSWATRAWLSYCAAPV
jgi:serine/threonine-protein kinase HipA